MLLCSLLVLSAIPCLVSTQFVQPSTSTANGQPPSPTGDSDDDLDLGHIGSTIGGASAGAVAVLIIGLAFAMLRWSRRQRCLYHNKELGEVVPSLRYQKYNVDVETASVDSCEGLQFPVPALLSPASCRSGATPTTRETHFELPPIYSPPDPIPTQPSTLGRS